MKRHYTDAQLIRGLRQRKLSSINYIYSEYFPVIRGLLREACVTRQDLEDLFQDTLTAVYMKCRDEQFNLTCSLKTYFVSVTKNLWKQRQERRRRLVYRGDLSVHEEQAGYYDPYVVTGPEREQEIQRLFHKNLLKLPEECRILLHLYTLKTSYREIAEMLNYKDEASVKSRKYTCKLLLRRRIMSDPECQPYISHE